jgi:type 1 fimbriae regulatory protein FimE
MSQNNELPRPPQPSPRHELGQVAPRRRSPENYLTREQVEQLARAAAKSGRYAQRDRTLVRMLFLHGLRSIEATRLQWVRHVQLDGRNPRLRVHRAKNGNPSTHPLTGAEVRALRQLKRDWPDSPYVFCSERGGQLTTRAVRYIIARLGQAAGLPFAHPHQLRHATGHDLAERGKDTRLIQDYLGHVSITHTLAYTQGTSARFVDLFPDD